MKRCKQAINWIFSRMLFNKKCSEIAEDWGRQCIERYEEMFVDAPEFWELDLGGLFIDCSLETIGVKIACNLLGSQGLSKAGGWLEYHLCTQIFNRWSKYSNPYTNGNKLTDPAPNYPHWPSSFSFTSTINFKNPSEEISLFVAYDYNLSAVLTSQVVTLFNGTTEERKSLQLCSDRSSVYSIIDNTTCQYIKGVDCIILKDYFVDFILTRVYNTTLQYAGIESLPVFGDTYHWIGSIPDVELYLHYFDDIDSRFPVKLEFWAEQNTILSQMFSSFDPNPPNPSVFNPPSNCQPTD
jgi:hypothetical protein